MWENSTITSLESQISSTRTVFDILWSCLFAIFACTWTVQHLNVPPQRDEDSDPGWKGDLKYALQNFWASAKWMVITVFAPELLITLNFGQLASAMTTVKGLKEFAEQDGVPWSLTHSLFANMGGFVVREYAPGRVEVLPSLDTESNSGQRAGAEATKTDSNSGQGIQTPNEAPSETKVEIIGNIESQPRPKEKTFFLLAHEIFKLREHGSIKLPYITRDEIMNEGKSDTFGRLIAMSQIAWLVVQIIVRERRGLEVSQLEIGTMAFATCAMIIYALNWHKPKSVNVPWTVWSFNGASGIPQRLKIVCQSQKKENWFLLMWRPYIQSLVLGPYQYEQYSRGPVIENNYHYAPKFEAEDPFEDKLIDLTEFLFLILSSTVFGSIHFAAIKSTFPSDLEKTSWCVASAVCTGIAMILLLTFFLSVMLAKVLCIFYWEAEDKLMTFSIRLVLLVYVLARLFLIVEIFRTLFFLPPSAFIATWVSSVPHVS